MNWQEYKKFIQSKPDKERRRLAMEWWNEHGDGLKEHYAQRYFDRNAESLTGREIQMIHEGDKVL